MASSKTAMAAAFSSSPKSRRGVSAENSNRVLFGTVNTAGHRRHITRGATALSVHWYHGDRVHGINPVDYGAKCGVLTVKVLTVLASEADEELTSCGIRIS